MGVLQKLLKTKPSVDGLIKQGDVAGLIDILDLTMKGEDGRKEAQGAIAKALGDLGDPCAIPPLERLVLWLDRGEQDLQGMTQMTSFRNAPPKLKQQFEADFKRIRATRQLARQALGALRTRQSQKAAALDPKISLPLPQRTASGTSGQAASASTTGATETDKSGEPIRNGMAVLEGAYLARHDESLDARVDSALDQVAAAGDPGVGALIERLNKGVTVSGSVVILQNWGDGAWNEFLKKACIANALGRAGAVSATPALASLTRSYSDVEQFNTIVRPAAATALNEICLKSGSGEFGRAIEGLIGGLGTGTGDRQAVTRDCLQHLCERVGEPVVRLLCTALEDDSDGDTRMYSALILGRVRMASALSALEGALDDRDLRVQQNAASALGKIGDSRAVDALAKALESGDMGVRNNAAISLGQIRDRRAVSGLTKALAGGNAQVRAAAEWALKQIGEP